MKAVTKLIIGNNVIFQTDQLITIKQNSRKITGRIIDISQPSAHCMFGITIDSSSKNNGSIDVILINNTVTYKVPVTMNDWETIDNLCDKSIIIRHYIKIADKIFSSEELDCLCNTKTTVQVFGYDNSVISGRLDSFELENNSSDSITIDISEPYHKMTRSIQLSDISRIFLV